MRRIGKSRSAKYSPNAEQDRSLQMYIDGLCNDPSTGHATQTLRAKAVSHLHRSRKPVGLQQLAAHWRAQMPATVVGITGSVGKQRPRKSLPVF